VSPRAGATAPTFLPPGDPTTALSRVLGDFARAHGRSADGVWSAPGRVNLIGEHTDYNGGLCLPLALRHRTLVAAAARCDSRVHITSRQSEQGFTGSVGEVGAGWTAYPTGVLWALRAAGVDVRGVDLRVDSAVPVGAGLSSSAALTCAVALAIAEQSGADITRAELVAACVRAENEVVGAPTGGMDQAIALLAHPDTALLLDCRDGSTEHLPLHLADAGLALLVIDTRAAHNLADGQYAQRRADCEAAALALGVPNLRAATGQDVGALHAPRLHARARHVVTEIARVSAVAALLRAGRLAETGPLLNASHVSLREDFAVSCAELDVAVDTAGDAGALGARMTGGGFGGSAVVLLRAGDAASVAIAVDREFARRGWRPPGFLLAEPSAAGSRLR